MFIADMGTRPPGTTLDRINNDGDYEPNNCKWATPFEQAANRSDTRLITFDGRTQHLSAWAAEKGMARGTLWSRLYLYNWTIEDALTIPGQRGIAYAARITS